MALEQDIPIQDISPWLRVVAVANQTDFAFTFPVFDQSDLKVYVDGTVKALAVDYTVTIATPPSVGGTVSFLSGLSAGQVVIIYREAPIKRESDFAAAGALRARDLNDDLDRIVTFAQELELILQGCVRIPRTEDLGSLTLEVTPVANGVLQFDANGTTLTAAAQLANDEMKVVLDGQGSQVGDDLPLMFHINDALGQALAEQQVFALRLVPGASDYQPHPNLTVESVQKGTILEGAGTASVVLLTDSQGEADITIRRAAGSGVTTAAAIVGASLGSQRLVLQQGAMSILFAP